MRVFNCFLLAILASALAFADTGYLDRSVVFKGETYAYQVYVPADYSRAKLWPIIVYLHGNGHQGSDGMRQTEAAFARSIRENRSLFPAIVVFPQAKTAAAWFFPEMENMVLAELDHTLEEFRCDARRIYLTGFSMGATGAYRIAYHSPNRFAALVVVAGRIQPGKSYNPQNIENDRRTNSFVAAPDPFSALAAQIKGIPIWVFHGDKDEAISVEQSRQLAAALKQAGADVRYTEYPGVTHTEAADKAYLDDTMVSWLFAQHIEPSSPSMSHTPSPTH